MWLPEPIATGEAPDDGIERIESLTMGFLLLLERLTPLERAVFVLHDVLDYPYRRDRRRPSAAPRPPAARRCTGPAATSPSPPAGLRPNERTPPTFASASWPPRSAATSTRFVAALAPDVVLTSDGGGIVHAAMRPVVGVERVSRFLANLAARAHRRPVRRGPRAQRLAGVRHPCRRVVGWRSSSRCRGDQVVAIRAVASPPKLERLLATLPEPADRPGAWDTPARFRHRQGHPVRP